VRLLIVDDDRSAALAFPTSRRWPRTRSLARSETRTELPWSARRSSDDDRDCLVHRLAGGPSHCSARGEPAALTSPREYRCICRRFADLSGRIVLAVRRPVLVAQGPPPTRGGPQASVCARMAFQDAQPTPARPRSPTIQSSWNRCCATRWTSYTVAASPEAAGGVSIRSSTSGTACSVG